MKYGRLVHVGDDIVILGVWDNLDDALRKPHPLERGIGPKGIVYELTGRTFEYVEQVVTTFREGTL